MRSKLLLALWAFGVLVHGSIVAVWLYQILTDWPIEWLFAFAPLPPFLLLSFGSSPVARFLWFRRVSFYLGLAWWLWLISAIVFGMFNPAFGVIFLFFGGLGLAVLAMFAPRAPATAVAR